MNKLKLVSLIMFVMLIFVCEKSKAQTEQNKDQQTQQTDPNTDAQFTDTSQFQNSEPYSSEPSQVTIDSTGYGNSGNYNTSADPGARQESTEKIHLYSGKHDGNNVINPGPKNP